MTPERDPAPTRDRLTAALDGIDWPEDPSALADAIIAADPSLFAAPDLSRDAEEHDWETARMVIAEFEAEVARLREAGKAFLRHHGSVDCMDEEHPWPDACDEAHNEFHAALQAPTTPAEDAG